MTQPLAFPQQCRFGGVSHVYTRQVTPWFSFHYKIARLSHFNCLFVLQFSAFWCPGFTLTLGAGAHFPPCEQ